MKSPKKHGVSSVPVRNRIRAVVGGIFRRPMIRAKAQFLEVARTSCSETQLAALQRLLKLNGDSRFSQETGLASGLTVTEFRDRIPVSDYEFFRPWVDQMQSGDQSALLGHANRLLMFAITSGTTSKPKLIPITDQFVADYRRGWQHWGIAAQQDHEALKRLLMVQITSNHHLWQTAGGIPCGNISGLVTSMQKAIVRKLYAVPAVVANIADSTAKQYAVLRFALAEKWVGMFVTANPGTLLQLQKEGNLNAEKLIRDIYNGTIDLDGIAQPVTDQLVRRLKPRPQRARELQAILDRHGSFDAAECWPQLSCLAVWSGGSAAAYRTELQSAFGDVSVRDHGLHASEGRMTIPFEDDSPVGLLDVQSHFFEFMPVSESASRTPVCLQAHELERDQEYYILLTTSSGLYRYNIQDVVCCRGFHGTTPLLEFLHKGAHISSITGEKLTESQVVEAVLHVAEHAAFIVSQFTLTPKWGTPPGYELYVQTQLEDDRQLQRFAADVDRRLKHQNCEYNEKRNTGRLAMIVCHRLPDVGWQELKRIRLETSGGSVEQYKHPCLIPDTRFESTFSTLLRSA